MKLDDFISKHSLSPIHFPTWKPAMLLMPDEAGEQFFDRYEFFANSDKTILVSLNRTRSRFRICYYEMVVVCSDWENAAHDFQLEPIQDAR